MGVVKMWLVGVVVRRYIDTLIVIITFPFSNCISSFFGSSIPTSLFFVLFPGLVYIIFVQYNKRCSNNIPDRSKIEITRIIINNYIDENYVERSSTARARVPRFPCARYHVTFQESCN